MTKYIIRRIASIIIVMLLVGLVACFIVHFIPGDIAIAMLGEDATPEQIAALRAELHLDRPVLLQYLYWLKDALHGNFGWSLKYQEEVGPLILSRARLTLYLGVIALVFSVILGIFLGTVCAVKRDKLADQLITVFANLGVSAPVFWIAIILVYVLSFKMGIFPISGYQPLSRGFVRHFRSIVLPIFILLLRPTATLVRQTRSAMLEAINQDYALTARSKGLKQGEILFKHVLKNAMIPIVTQIGLQVRNVIGGSVLVETVFNLPGMGRLAISSVLDKDIYVVQAVIVLIAMIVSLASLFVDISYGYFNPRVRIGKS